MADQLEQLKSKYESVFNFMQQKGVQLQNVNLQDNKLFIRGTAPSQEVKNEVWNQIKLVDPSYSDLIADIQGPAAQAAVAGASASASATGGSRTYTVKSGDNLSKISKEFYDDANQYTKIVDANRGMISDPDKIKPGMNLLIP